MHGPLTDLENILGRNNCAEPAAVIGQSASHDSWSERLRPLQVAHFDFSVSTKIQRIWTSSSLQQPTSNPPSRLILATNSIKMAKVQKSEYSHALATFRIMPRRLKRN